MKHIISKFVVFASIISLLMVTACVDDETTMLPQQLETWRAQSITSTSAELSGFVVAEGEGLAETGVVYGLSENPTIDDNKVMPDSLSKAVYWVTVSNLEHFTTYYYRAYALDNNGATVYGEESNFSTLANIATVNIGTASDITDLSALVSAEIPYDGKSEVTERGICWNTESGTTTENSKVTSGEGTGDFLGLLENLFGNETYYVRAYAINSVGTAYSNEITFTTPAGTPRISASEVNSVEKTTAKVVAELSHSGGADVTEVGICYSLASNPTTDNMKVVAADTELSSKEYTLEGLEMNTTYYVRAYAINSVGTSYSDELTFTTKANIDTWYLPGDYLDASYPESGYANWDPASSPSIMNTLDDPNNLEGYMYLANDASQWKFATQPNWDGPNYTGDGSGNLSEEGDNISSPAGYYKVNVDLSTDPMTYTALATTWGVIGDATPGGWDSDTDLTYNPASRQWEGVMHLTAAEIKFRANDGWDLNYGSDTGTSPLYSGQSNIPIATEGDYAISLDLGSPRNYSFTANTWGVIGGATPTGWDSDTDMVWDEANSVFTVTLDLTLDQIKFRANDGWDLNYGGELGALTVNGDNINIPEAGNYTITFNPFTKIGTITKN